MRQCVRYSTSGGSSNSHDLRDSRNISLKLLYNLKSWLNKSIKFYKVYQKCIEKYLTLGHIKVVTRAGRYFIHHAEVKQDGDVSKLRFVFDSTAFSSSRASLDDVLWRGPKWQIDISDILLKCCLSKCVFTADIAKMSQQIMMRSEDWIYQHIFWKRSPEHEIQEYELLTVSFCVNTMPFSLLSAFMSCILAPKIIFPPLKESWLTELMWKTSLWANDKEELVLGQNHIIGLLGLAGCVLKKWANNSRQILDRISLDDYAKRPMFDPEDTPSIKVLGLQ